MRIGRSTATHGMSKHDLYRSLKSTARRLGLSIDWKSFVERHPIPREYIDGSKDCHAGLIDPSQPATVENVGWVLTERRDGI